jgi:hypothetical protein
MGPYLAEGLVVGVSFEADGLGPPVLFGHVAHVAASEFEGGEAGTVSRSAGGRDGRQDVGGVGAYSSFR